MLCSRSSACGLKKPQFSGVVHLGPLLGKAMGQLERNLHAVGIAHHVVVKHDAAHAGQLHAARLQRIAAADFKPLGAVDDLLARDSSPASVEPAVGPMAMRTEHARQLAALALRPIQSCR